MIAAQYSFSSVGDCATIQWVDGVVTAKKVAEDIELLLLEDGGVAGIRLWNTSSLLISDESRCFPTIYHELLREHTSLKNDYENLEQKFEQYDDDY